MHGAAGGGGSRAGFVLICASELPILPIVPILPLLQNVHDGMNGGLH